MKNAPRNFPEQKIDVFKIYIYFFTVMTLNLRMGKVLLPQSSYGCWNSLKTLEFNVVFSGFQKLKLLEI